MTTPPLVVGQRVAYSARFCQSIGAYCGDIPHARGTVASIQGRMIYIRWDARWADMPCKVLDANLAIVAPSSRFCAC